MIRHIDWDDYRHRTMSFALPPVIDSIRVELDGGRVKITINDQEVFRELGTGTRDCLIQIDRQPATEHDWVEGSGSEG